MPSDSSGRVTTARWNVVQSRWLEEDLLTVRGATTSGNRPWHEVDLGSTLHGAVVVGRSLGKISLSRGNCGPHTLRLIEYILAGRRPFDWSEDYMGIIREKMAVEIFCNSRPA
ncbi:hypothetical protein Ddye_009347 [Dipteronia dyeriana]|uniref:Uncharacterized protein n=1 Tax=Dipteronia dyeriana TaxID=168575 RepID=A0AAD9XB73_9ROSI|nr:hypothetical protein Ddye_009347 [Dipteronia dyeriana]